MWENWSFLTAHMGSRFWLAYRYKMFSKTKIVTQARKALSLINVLEVDSRMLLDW